MAAEGLPRLIISTAGWIKNHLLEVGEDYPYNMWRELRNLKLEMGVIKKGIGSYQNFRNYIYWLEKLGLIKFVREEEGDKTFLAKRRYYAVVEDQLDNPAWSNPNRALYPETWEKWH